MKQFLLISLFLMSTLAEAALKDVLLYSLNSKKKEALKLDSKKLASVVIFLSKDCPCSKANLSHLNELSQEFKNIQFIGVHAKKGSTNQEVESYFAKEKLLFSVYSDESLKLADELGALKTPQAFVLDSKSQIVFSGGMTNTTHPKNAKNFYLREALSDISSNKIPKISQATSLGCYIVR